ncbi:MAG: helix-turn-helix transcriptional regulator [Pseudomonadota bacterium]
MTGRTQRPEDRGRRLWPAALAVFVAIQTVAAVFFAGEAMTEASVTRNLGHGLVEGTVALALALGVVFGAVALRRTLERMRRQEDALDTARGALSAVIDRQFAAWSLTPAERDVGLLALKGLDVAEIAGFRGAAQGTVRAQLASIYAKAGVSGRAQFGAHFVEDLLSEGVG